MERLFNWESGVYENLENVYEKAAKDECFANLLYELEYRAFNCVRANAHFFQRKNGEALTEEMLSALPKYAVEPLIHNFAKLGLKSFDIDDAEGKLIFYFTENVKYTLPCTLLSMFDIVENMSRFISDIHPNWTIEIHYAKREAIGIVHWERMFDSLYPNAQLSHIYP